jgi:2-oxoglutarate ferredoxin oxidoreductase subunit gamma
LLIALSQDGYQRNVNSVERGGVLLIDEDFVHPGKDGAHPLPEGCAVATVPATRFAQECGNKIMANMVMLGFAAAVTEIVSKGAVEAAVADSVPHGTETMNLTALHKGYDYGQKWLHENGDTPTLLGRTLA